MAKKDEVKKNSTTQNNERKEERKKLKETSISEYTPEQLVEMFNTTSGQDLKEKYPDVDFAREQIRNHLEKEYHMHFLNTMIIPEYMDRMEVYRLVKESMDGSKKGSGKGAGKDAKTKTLVYKLAQETVKQSCTMAVETKKRWDEFLKKRGVRKQLVQAYMSSALELLMDMVEGGEAEVVMK